MTGVDDRFSIAHTSNSSDRRQNWFDEQMFSIYICRRQKSEMWHNSIWLKDVNLNLGFIKSWFCNFVTSCTALAVFICFAWHFSFLPDTRRCDLYGRSFTSSPMSFTNGRFYGFGKKFLIFFKYSVNLNIKTRFQKFIFHSSGFWHEGLVGNNSGVVLVETKKTKCRLHCSVPNCAIMHRPVN